MTKFGYARVSTEAQHLDNQINQLLKAGIDRKNIYTDTISGKRAARPGLDAMRAKLHQDDEVVVVKLDRLGRSMQHVINLVAEFRENGVEFTSINDNIDTSTINGRLLLGLLTSMAEYERELIRERTMAGLETARAQGRVGGRKKAMTPELARKIDALVKADYKAIEIAADLGVSRASAYRYLDEYEAVLNTD